MEMQFESQKFGSRLKSMLSVDFRRTFTTPLYYIMVAIALLMPVLILVMTTAMPSTTIDPVTGVEKEMETFTNVWQAIGSTAAESSAMDMSLIGMCNINMLYFIIAVPVCIFVSDDFRSGYAKNLFTVRAKKTDYVISKICIAFVTAASMLIAFFVGALLGGKISGLSFAVGTAGVGGIVCCILSKILLSLIFTSIFVTMSVVGKQRLWLSLLGAFGVGMLFFTMVPMITPLDSTLINVLLCAVGGGGIAVGLGAVSNLILKKTSLV